MVESNNSDQAAKITVRVLESTRQVLPQFAVVSAKSKSFKRLDLVSYCRRPPL